MIPKVIHYCWFGGNELPEKARKCIESWKKFCPDCEIKEWNEQNFDLNCCDYVREAYQAKKWAFVSDYARFQILYDHGGLYFDTDVEVIRPLDELLEKGPYMGFEEGKRTRAGMNYQVNPGLGLACEPGMPLIREVLDYYQTIHFLDENGGQNTTTIVQYTTDILKKHGLENKPEIQYVAGIYLYPPEFFCPMDFNTGKMNITENTHSIHHFMATWFTGLDWLILKIERKFSDGGNGKYLLGQMIILPFRLVRKVKNIGVAGTIQLIIRKIKKNG